MLDVASGNQTWQCKIHENPAFLDDFSIKASIYRGSPIATFDYRRVASGNTRPSTGPRELRQAASSSTHTSADLELHQ